MRLGYITSMDISSYEKAAAVLKGGGALIYPTDTVWGIGVAVRFCDSPKALFEAKGRAEDKPVAWLIGSADDLAIYGSDVPDYAFELARRHWPGALTLVVRASNAVPKPYRCASATIGLRMPASPAALRLIRETGCPLATTSANVSGEPSVPSSMRPRRALVDALGANLFDPYAIGAGQERPTASAGNASQACRPTKDHDAAEAAEGAASTVIDCTSDEPRILRMGALVDALGKRLA